MLSGRIHKWHLAGGGLSDQAIDGSGMTGVPTDIARALAAATPIPQLV
jgi:hypothetical protein